MTSKDQTHIDPDIQLRARELRKEPTAAEKKLWRRLRDEQIPGCKFRRQQPIGRFIVDFFCSESRLVVEIDGDTHAEQESYDASRTEWLTKKGYRVIRFANADVLYRLNAVLEVILEECQRNE